jgi:exosome complex RNA-binding protein Csl4
MILRCTCINKFQDKKYGKKLRIFNRLGDAKSLDPMYKCTVCGNERTRKIKKYRASL